jgi:hypothetical protein
MKELWKTVPGFPSYSASNKGQIKRTKPHPNGPKICGGVLKGQSDGHGYYRVSLFRNDKKRYVFKVHAVILMTFVGSRPKNHVCNHKNGIKTDNSIENIEWVTCGENNQHAYDMGLKRSRELPVGENHHLARLSNGEVWLIKKLLHHGIKQSLIAKMFKVERYYISRIKRGSTWNHLQYP